ncbi:MAG: TetR/AcrR family transcriptional regulator [Betaproteobacteria bacterium]|jgi:AcrR family transcriptional regulator|nr:TetR/AcrR family transcriptional regulator [Betaproteobacteria bacterium]
MLEASQTTQLEDDTQAAILRAAVIEFGEHGLTGARVDAIAERAATNKRMIYYYFHDKEGLYLAALEASYKKIRDQELDLHLDVLDPEAALRRLVAINFDHHVANEHYIRLVMSENMNRGRTLAKSDQIEALNRPALTILSAIYSRGVDQGVFRPGLNPVDIHASISALTFYNVSNRYTFGMIFQVPTHSPSYMAMRREHIIEMMVCFLKVQPSPSMPH